MYRVVAVGTDLHSMTRFRNILKRNGDLSSFKSKRFAQKILNPRYEMPLFEDNLEKKDMEVCSKILSVSWCVKEAIYKTLDSKDQNQFIMSNWYKINDDKGRPIIGVEGYENWDKEQFHCSISHDADLVSAFVLRQSL